jgi:hypothetical protein
VVRDQHLLRHRHADIVAREDADAVVRGAGKRSEEAMLRIGRARWYDAAASPSEFIMPEPLVVAGVLGAGSLMILASMGGVIVALVLWGRCPRAASLAAAASGLLLVASLLAVFLLPLVHSFAPENQHLVLVMAAISRAALEASAIALFIAAAFVGRSGTQSMRSGTGVEEGIMEKRA